METTKPRLTAVKIDLEKDAKMLKRIKDDPEWALRSIRRMILSLEQYDKRIKRYEAKEIAELEAKYDNP